MSEENGDRNWSDVRFRPRRVGGSATPEDASHSRFVYGVLLFVGVALVYPWYSYRVQSRLMEADAKKALAAAEVEMRKFNRHVDGMLDGAPEVQRAIPLQDPSPRIVGVSEGAATSVIVADLDGASLRDATPVLCADATRWTGRQTAGRTFRVQSYRRTAPAITVGTIQC